MNDEMTLPSSLKRYLDSQAQSPVGPFELLQDGAISTTIRFMVNTGNRYVMKHLHNVAPHFREYVRTYLDGVPSDIYEKEAEGLQTLNLPDCPRVPNVIAVTAEFLLLEDLGNGQRSDTYWEDFGRQMATLHTQHGESFGYHAHNYLGLARQSNARMDDGHEFYAQHRILRYLDEGHCKNVLTREDRQQLTRFCERLWELVPSQPPSLCHGDLCSGNVVVTHEGEPAYLDPAVYYGWAEDDLGLTTRYPGVDERFYDAYEESGNLEAGWRERLEIYHVKEVLSSVAHCGESGLSLLRNLLKKYT